MASMDEFFNGTRYAIVGTDPAEAYGRALVAAFGAGRRRAFVVFPERARGTASSGAIYGDLREVPGPLDGVILNIEHDPQRMLREVQLAVELGVPRVWIENRCEAGEAVAYALAHGVEVVDNICPLLVLDSHHIHWVHRKALNLFGRTPQVLGAVRDVPAAHGDGGHA